MGKRGALVLLFGGAWAVGMACSSFEEAAEPAAEGGAGDAGVVVEAGPDALAPNGDFEATGPGCGGGWDQTYYVTLEKTEPGRTGGKACRVCTVPKPPNGAAGYYAVKAPVPGTYTLEAWHKTIPGEPAPKTVNVQLQAFDGDGGYDLKASRPASGDTWASAQVTLPVPPGTTVLNIGIGMFQADAGECLVFDDVVLVRKP